MNLQHISSGTGVLGEHLDGVVGQGGEIEAEHLGALPINPRNSARSYALVAFCVMLSN